MAGEDEVGIDLLAVAARDDLLEELDRSHLLLDERLDVLLELERAKQLARVGPPASG